jgi:hypothetical protein
MIMGFASLAVDAGFGLNDRRDTQNAADIAALAAAWEDCNPRLSGAPNPIAAARASAKVNAYDHDLANVDVAVNDISASASSRTRVWEVVITSTNDTYLANASVIERDELTVQSRAVGSCERLQFLGGYAIFAGGDTTCGGGVELDLSGASKIVNGSVHSNGDVKVTGASTTITGTVTYRGSANLPAGVSEEKLFGSAYGYPVQVSMDEYRAGGSRRTRAQNDPNDGQNRFYDAGATDIDDSWIQSMGYGTKSGSDTIINKSGIYFTEGDIDVSGLVAGTDPVSGDTVTATFVANGQIHITGNTDLTAYDPLIGGPTDPGVVMFSNYLEPPAGPTCTGNAIQFSVSAADWTGIIFAPHGQAKLSFSSSSTLNGGIFAYTVDVSGSSFELSWYDNPSATPDYEVQLTE